MVVLVYETRFVDTGAFWVAIREAVQAVTLLPVPYTWACKRSSVRRVTDLPYAIAIISDCEMLFELVEAYFHWLTSVVEETSRSVPWSGACHGF